MHEQRKVLILVAVQSAEAHQGVSIHAVPLPILQTKAQTYTCPQKSPTVDRFALFVVWGAQCLSTRHLHVNVCLVLTYMQQ